MKDLTPGANVRPVHKNVPKRWAIRRMRKTLRTHSRLHTHPRASNVGTVAQATESEHTPPTVVNCNPAEEQQTNDSSQHQIVATQPVVPGTLLFQGVPSCSNAVPPNSLQCGLQGSQAQLTQEKREAMQVVEAAQALSSLKVSPFGSVASASGPTPFLPSLQSIPQAFSASLSSSLPAMLMLAPSMPTQEQQQEAVPQLAIAKVLSTPSQTLSQQHEEESKAPVPDPIQHIVKWQAKKKQQRRKSRKKKEKMRNDEEEEEGVEEGGHADVAIVAAMNANDNDGCTEENQEVEDDQENDNKQGEENQEEAIQEEAMQEEAIQEEQEDDEEMPKKRGRGRPRKAGGDKRRKGTRGGSKKKKKAARTQKSAEVTMCAGYTEAEKERWEQLVTELSELRVPQLKKMLKLNQQSMTGNKQQLVERVADGELLGAIPRCASCGGGFLKWDPLEGAYSCNGYMDDTEWKHCNFKGTKDSVVRTPWLKLQSEE